MLKQFAEDGKLIRFGYVIGTWSDHPKIFDGTKFVPLHSPEGATVFNEMVDQIHKKLEELDGRTIGLVRLR